MKVLIIDDDNDARNELESAFRDCKEVTFDVEKAQDIGEADTALKRTGFDVMTVDLKFGKEVTAGLQWMQKQMILASCPEAIKVVVTAFPTLDRCVKAMRFGAWDFIDKEGNYGQKVVERVVSRIKELQEAKRIERFIFDEWLPENERALEQEHAGEYVAIDGSGRILAFGESMIALGGSLPGEWLTSEQKPYILHIQKRSGNDRNQ